MYSVKEIYYTLQGEGAQAGRPAVFCRFAGCNLWSGREEDRADATCKFCDTDFVDTDGTDGGKFAAAEELARACRAVWKGNSGTPHFVVLTGGEPMLQVDEPLIDALHSAGFEIAIETNGTLPVPRSIDWICVSPKEGAKLSNWSIRKQSLGPRLWAISTSGTFYCSQWTDRRSKPIRFPPLSIAWPTPNGG